MKIYNCEEKRNYNKPRVYFILRDTRHFKRICKLTFESGGFINGKGYKLSVALHPRVFMWIKEYSSFRLTVLGASIHFRKN